MCVKGCADRRSGMVENETKGKKGWVGERRMNKNKKDGNFGNQQCWE
jgi:hypothetical protein